MPMQASDVADVILLNTLLAVSEDTPSLIARLIDWKNGVNYDEPETLADPKFDAMVADKPKSKRGKATESNDSDFEPTPDPTDEPF